MIAYRKSTGLYVAQFPGYGGVDWGYTKDPNSLHDPAIELSLYWRNRFAANARRCGDEAVFVDVKGVDPKLLDWFKQGKTHARPLKSVVIGGIKYRVGDRIWYRNTFRQEFYETIVRVYKDPDGKSYIFGSRPDWMNGNEHSLDPDHWVLSRIWPGADRDKIKK